MPPLVSQGIELAMYGMGAVFVFLILLILATMLMSKLVAMTSQPETTPAAAPATTGITAQKLAAITAAIQQHRDRQQG